MYVLDLFMSALYCIRNVPVYAPLLGVGSVRLLQLTGIGRVRRWVAYDSLRSKKESGEQRYAGLLYRQIVRITSTFHSPLSTRLATPPSAVHICLPNQPRAPVDTVV